MEKLIRALCALSIFCGAAQSLAPEGRGKKAMGFVCAVVILACVVNAVKSLDPEEYALEIALQRERKEAFLRESTQARQSLERMVIEGECEAYILDTAGRLQLPLQRAEVRAKWSLEGLWVPYSVKLEGALDGEQRKRLSDVIETELGIPGQRQEWSGDGSEKGNAG